MNRSFLRRAMYSRRVTRRGFLQLGGVAASAAFFAACGGQTNVAPAISPTAAPVAPTALPTNAPTAVSAAARELFLYNWSDYIAPETVESFQKDLNATLVQDYYASNEDLLAKIEAGGVGYDVVVPSEYMVQIMAERDMLLSLDWSRIPNTRYLSPPFDKGRPHDPDNKWSVPKNWGTFGIMWNTEQVSDEFTAWADLWRLAPKYSGKIVLVDSAPEVFGAALKLLGYSYNSTNPKEIDAALEKLVELKPHVRSFESNQGGMFVTGEAVLGMGWNGDAASANAQRAVAGSGETIVYAVPSEGSLLWEDDWAILKTAPHPDLAFEFINYVIDPPRQAAETNYSYYGSPQEQAKKFINPDVLADPAVYPPAQVMARLEPAKSLPDEALQYREEAWTKLKSA